MRIVRSNSKWHLWHGKVGETFHKTEEIQDYLEELKKYKVDKKTKSLWHLCR